MPINTSLPVTVEFINWGHLMGSSGSIATTALLLDDVIVNTVPAPGALAPLGLVPLGLLRRRR